MTATMTSSVLETAAHARLLSIGFSAPTEARLRQLEQLAAGLDHEDVIAALRATELVALAGEHERLFGPVGVCPPYEGLYEPDPFRETRQLADVAGFYSAFGAEASGPAHERPDHVGCELEFLAFLVLRRANGEPSPEAADTAAAAENAFLRDHLGRWLGRFCEDVLAATEDRLYRSLAASGTSFIKQELTARGLDVKAAGPRRRRGGTQNQELACGDGCGTATAGALLQIHGQRLA